ncbi:hypothetical protein JCM11251_007713 [Rhodosporidiobolus azoricus]
MQTYKFPRSGGSLDLTDPSTIPPPQHHQPAQPEPPSHPSLLITDDSGRDSYLAEPSATLSDADYLARFTSATNTLLSSSQSAPNPGHLSVGTLPGGAPASKSLSRISEVSEYSVSAYSSNTRDSSNSSPFGGLAPETPSHSADPSRSSSPTPSPIDPAFPHNAPPASFSFPVPPPHAHLPPPQPALPSSPKRHHLPSRPLTTPVPLANPSPVPVPIDNFARPPGQERAGSPVMVQFPGRAPVLPASSHQPPTAYHMQKDSETSSQWATAEDEKFGSESSAFGAAGVGATKAGVFFPGDGYDGASLSGASSQNRFTLDADDRFRREKAPAGGWEEEGGKKGNKRIWIALILVAIVAVAVGVGVGVGQKKANEDSKEKNAAAAEASDTSSSLSSSPTSSSTSSSSSLRTSIIRLSATSAPTAASAETYSTTFAFSRSGTSTVVPLTYTIPTSYDVRANGQWQFTQEVVLPAIHTGGRATGSFTSDLRFRVEPTTAASSAGGATATRRVTVEKRDGGVKEENLAERRRWERSLVEGTVGAQAVKRHIEGARMRERMIR